MASSRVVIVAPRIRNGPLSEHTEGVEIRRVAYARKGRERVAEDAILPAIRSDRRLILQVPRLMLGLLRETFRQTSQVRPAVIHAHWILPGGLIAMVVGLVRRVPYVVTAHGADAYALDGRIGRLVKRMVLRRALAVYPVSAEIADRLEGMVGHPLDLVLPMGVDCDRLVQESGPRDPEPGTVLFVGRLSDKKGVDVLLRAVASAPTVRKLRIVGEGPDRPALEALVNELELHDRVEFTGHATRAQVLEEYRKAAVVAIPSRTGAGGDRDGTPVVLMEAMALGAPVVASDLGGIADQVSDGRTGRLVPPADDRALSEALADLLRAPHVARQLGEAAAEHARMSFDIHTIAAQMEDDMRMRLGLR